MNDHGYPGPGGRKSLIAGIGALVVAGLVTLVLLLAGVFSSDASATPRDQVKKLLEATKAHDVGAAKKVLCVADQGLAAQFVGHRRRRLEEDSGSALKTYAITSVRTSGTAGEASFTITDGSGRQASATVPLRKERGTWKVCPRASS